MSAQERGTQGAVLEAGHHPHGSTQSTAGSGDMETGRGAGVLWEPQARRPTDLPWAHEEGTGEGEVCRRGGPHCRSKGLPRALGPERPCPAGLRQDGTPGPTPVQGPRLPLCPSVPGAKRSEDVSAGGAQWVGVSSHRMNGRQLDSWSGHVTSLQVQSPLGACMTGNWSVPLSH